MRHRGCGIPRQSTRGVPQSDWIAWSSLWHWHYNSLGRPSLSAFRAAIVGAHWRPGSPRWEGIGSYGAILVASPPRYARASTAIAECEQSPVVAGRMLQRSLGRAPVKTDHVRSHHRKLRFKRTRRPRTFTPSPAICDEHGGWPPSVEAVPHHRQRDSCACPREPRHAMDL
jgi:hypothetical protein